MRALALVPLLAACGSFEDPDVVIDMRVLAMAADRPEQVIEVDLANPMDEVALLEQVEPAEMCALVADPGIERRLRWSMTLCVLDSDERCRASRPQVVVGAGVIEDPDVAAPVPRMCATVNPDGNLLGVVRAAFEDDEFSGLGGIDYGIGLVVGAEGGDPALDLYAGKTLRLSPKIPAERTANTNPSVDGFEISIDGGAPVALPLGRCVEQAAPITVGPRAEVRITPLEAAGAREIYVVPTLDGGAREFTEALTYQWLTGAGGFSSGSTGGTRDVSGNYPPLFTDYRAPAAEDLAGVTDAPLWIVQRDERLGARWYESCLRVVP